MRENTCVGSPPEPMHPSSEQDSKPCVKTRASAHPLSPCTRPWSREQGRHTLVLLSLTARRMLDTCTGATQPVQGQTSLGTSINVNWTAARYLYRVQLILGKRPCTNITITTDALMQCQRLGILPSASTGGQPHPYRQAGRHAGTWVWRRALPCRALLCCVLLVLSTLLSCIINDIWAV